jgi:hypothetical protein
MKLEELTSALKSIREVLPKDLSTDRILASMGLEARRSRVGMVVSGVALFSAGIAVGAVLGAIFAPKSGMELRADLAEKLEGISHPFRKDASKDTSGATA